MSDRIFRFIHRAWAWVFRHFWTSCPRCGYAFGGHEPHGLQLKFPNEPHYRIACEHCAVEHKALPAP